MTSRHRSRPPVPTPRSFPALALSLCVVAVLALVGCGPGGRAAADGSRSVDTRPSSGCRSGGAVPAQARGTDLKISMAGGRWYLRRVPRSYDGRRPLPVVVDLHGYSGSAEAEAERTGFGVYGDDHGFVTVTPQGSGSAPMWDTSPDSADVRFVGALLDHVEAGICVDRNRIYVAGMSNGALMASVVACVYADRVAAAAPVSGLRAPPTCRPSRPVPVISFHGTADRYVPWEGGIGEMVTRLPAPDGNGTVGESRRIMRALDPGGPPIAGAAAAWARLDGCEAKPSRTRVAPGIVRTSYECPRGVDVVLYRTDGGGHVWPGGAAGPAPVPGAPGPRAQAGSPAAGVPATAWIWDFFRSHPMPEVGR